MGGIAALGANCFDMVLAGGFVGYWVFRLVAEEDSLGPVSIQTPLEDRTLGFRKLLASS